jgi:glycosyltransferase involved in cell wall biosynthesis
MSERIMLFIPIFNCEKQITRVLDKITPKIQTRFEEIVIVNNRSTDDSEKAAISACKKIKKSKTTVLRNLKNYGLGGSHKVAFKYALQNNFDYCLVLHGDDQGNIQDILVELDKGEHRNYDCLLNSRFMPGSSRVGYSKIRTIGNWAFNLLFSLASRRIQWDLGSGLCCYSRKFLLTDVIRKCSDDLTFNYTLQLHAASKNVSQKFFPSTWVEDDQISNVKLFQQTLQMFKILLFYIFKFKSNNLNSSSDHAFAYNANVVFQQHL